jgi:hypothetical protein
MKRGPTGPLFPRPGPTPITSHPYSSRCSPCSVPIPLSPRPSPASKETETEDASFAAAQPGKLDRSWLTNRRVGTGRLGDDYVDVGHSQTIAHLRPHFIEQARELGLPDFDAAVIRMSAPRILTREVSRFL